MMMSTYSIDSCSVCSAVVSSSDTGHKDLIGTCCMVMYMSVLHIGYFAVPCLIHRRCLYCACAGDSPLCVQTDRISFHDRRVQDGVGRAERTAQPYIARVSVNPPATAHPAAIGPTISPSSLSQPSITHRSVPPHPIPIRSPSSMNPTVSSCRRPASIAPSDSPGSVPICEGPTVSASSSPLRQSP